MSGLILILLLIAGVPAALTILNVLDLAYFGARVPLIVSRLRADIVTMILGPLLSILDWHQLAMPEHNAPAAIYCGVLSAPHTLLAEAHLPTFGILFGLGIAAYMILRRYGHRLPPSSAQRRPLA